MSIAPSFEVFVLRPSLTDASGSYTLEKVTPEAARDEHALSEYVAKLRKRNFGIRVVVNYGGAWREVMRHI